MAHPGNVLMNRRARVVARSMTALILPLLLVTAGCSSTAPGEDTATAPKENSTMAPTESNTMKDAFEALLKRPDLAEVEADYQSMFGTIRERLTAEVGVGVWVPDPEPMSGTFCVGLISNLEGAGQRLYSAGTSQGNLPDARWDQAVTIVTEVAGQHGFGAPQVIVNGPGDHEVELHDTYQGWMLFGTGANTILTGGTGCHLTREAHQRGTYLPPRY
jgi:hypothetical protein